MNHYIKHIIASLLFVNMNVFACQILPSSDYTFDYTYHDNVLEYKIKNKKDIQFYSLSMTGMHTNLINGFFFVDKSAILKKTGGIWFMPTTGTTNLQMDYLFDYFLEKNILYSDYIDADKLSQSYPYPFNGAAYAPSKYLVKTSLVEDKLNLSDWLANFKDFYPENKKYGSQQIIFQVKIPQDEWAKTCLVFQTKPLAVSFPTKFEVIVKEWKEQIFGKPNRNNLDQLNKK